MKIVNVLIEDRIKEKILNKHNVQASEIKLTLLNKPLVLKSKENRYLALGYGRRHLTIVFEMEDETAFIITAYPSSEGQKKLYREKRK